VQNVVPEVNNADDPVGGWQGVPTEMTGVAALLKRAGYTTRAVGKWDVGMATAAHHHPRARGFDSWTGYWHHANDYWSHAEGPRCDGKAIRDLWHYNATFDGPMAWEANAPTCSQANQTAAPPAAPCVFEEKLLADTVVGLVENHDAANASSPPLFLYWAMHLVHMPLQIPDAYLDRFPAREYPTEHHRFMLAMVSYMDDEVGRVVDALARNHGMLNDTVITFHADNGGEILGAGLCGGNNWPLTGGKFSNFEGGIRVNAFVSGGAIPAARRGITLSHLGTVWDWYATYAQGIGGVDPADARAEAAGLPPIDSVNHWPYLMGLNATAPRDEIIIGDTTAINPNADGRTRVGGVLRADGWKLLLGPPDKLYTVGQYVQTGPNWPNATSHLVPLLHPKTCGRKAKRGCLFNVFDDPTERLNRAEGEEALFAEMLARVDAVQKSAEVYSPIRGKPDPKACEVAEEKYGGYWGPFYD
jgi:arylsulfatase B